MVVMGHVIGPHGILGCIKVHPYTEYIGGLLDYSAWWIGNGDGTWREVEIATARTSSGNTLQVRLKECADRTLATQLTGMQIAIPRNQLPNLPETGEEGYYWSDLIGAQVINLQDQKLGSVIGLLETGANDVLQVQSADKNKEEILIPFIDQAVINIDLESGVITVDWGIDY